MSAASRGKESCQYAYSYRVRAVCPFRTSPCSWRFPGDHSKVVAQMRLIRKSTFERDVAQRHIGLKHVLGSQFDATPDHKAVGRASECVSKGAGKVRFAALYQRT